MIAGARMLSSGVSAPLRPLFEAVYVLLAVTLVQWFNSGSVSRI